MKLQTSLFALFFFALSCDTSEPPSGGEPSVQFSAVDASCTEVWLQVKSLEDNQLQHYRIQRDTTTIFYGTITNAETLLVDEGLLPNKTYTYRITRLAGGSEENATTTTQTLNPTGHNFVWEIDTLGVGNSSFLYDVVIVNDTLAYAVGEIYLRDSTGQIDPTSYCLAVWNGSNWSPKRLYYNGSSLILNVRGIFVASPNEIWLAAGSVFRWDGSATQTQLSFSRLSLPDPNATIEKLCGTSSTNFYGVGNAGTIVHYSNGVWQALNSGTELNIPGVWCDPGSSSVICVASDGFVNNGVKLLGIVNDTVAVLPDSGLPWSLQSIWHKRNKYYVAGDGLFTTNSLGSDSFWSSFHAGLTTYYSNAIRGQALNDIFVGGAFGDLLHFNGVFWRRYTSGEVPALNGVYNAVEIKGNQVMAVGFSGGMGIVLRGTRH